MEVEIPKVYSPEAIEPRWARAWVEQRLYRPGNDPARRDFCLTIPPPNITGSLHMGHMLEHTEIDIVVRWRRMRGENVLWVPGTDHASIATQMIVERELGREALPQLEGRPEAKSAWQREGQRKRLEMGREKFLERCWQWKEANGGAIRRQMERLGASVDWTRDRFTMDPAYSRAVVETFVRLYEEGLIYRGKYIVNWCPRCGTAVSDLEVAHEERVGHLWFIRYPFDPGPGFVTVATTRPETMLGDTAIAVNPDDQHRQAFIGRNVLLPLANRAIPIVADEIVDPAFGTGVMKVTPGHDAGDYEVGRRHSLPAVTVIDLDGRMTDTAGPYRGLDRYQAREAVIRDLEALKLVEKTEDLKFPIPICTRCHTVVEPLVSTQWFMKMDVLAQPAIAAVEEGRIRIVPDNYRKIYLDWMNRIHDWCVSRQLWWGHRIPAWYCDACNQVIVARETPTACPQCRDGSLRPETDVLDTWFSSALWPFATLGWPEETPDLRRFYPNSLMIMGFDILFFWAARMIMMGMKLTNDIPFRKLYIHALVRDAERQKMSKTKGNVLDPLAVTEKYGTDAVRFALAASAAPGTDIALSKDKIESYRAFANKIWNAGRFILMNLGNLSKPTREQLAAALEPMPDLGFEPVAAAPATSTSLGEHQEGLVDGARGVALEDRWIFSRLLAVTHATSDALDDFRFHEAAHTIYHFFWHEFCDWYLEWVKPEITRPPTADRASPAWINLIRAFESALHLLHPFMPFITEELAHQLPHNGHITSISLTAFQLASDRVADSISEKHFAMIQELVIAARNAKAEMGLQKQKPSAQVGSEDLRVLELYREHQEGILRLAGLEALNFTRGRLAPDAGSVRSVSSGVDLRLLSPPASASGAPGAPEARADAAAARARLVRDRARFEAQLAGLKQQLENDDFRRRAPHDVVRAAEQRYAELLEQYRKVKEALEQKD